MQASHSSTNLFRIRQASVLLILGTARKREAGGMCEVSGDPSVMPLCR
jgi:hypothetical protein